MDLYDKSEVGEALMRAQTAILNPNRNYKEIASPNFWKPDEARESSVGLNGQRPRDGGRGKLKQVIVRGLNRPPANHEDEVKFSPNVVVMEVGLLHEQSLLPSADNELDHRPRCSKSFVHRPPWCHPDH